MLLVVSVIALVFSTILPHVVAKAVHHTILEAALEEASVSPLEAPIAAHLVIRPVACVL